MFVFLYLQRFISRLCISMQPTIKMKNKMRARLMKCYNCCSGMIEYVRIGQYAVEDKRRDLFNSEKFGSKFRSDFQDTFSRQSYQKNLQVIRPTFTRTDDVELCICKCLMERPSWWIYRLPDYTTGLGEFKAWIMKMYVPFYFRHCSILFQFQFLRFFSPIYFLVSAVLYFSANDLYLHSRI